MDTAGLLWDWVLGSRSLNLGGQVQERATMEFDDDEKRTWILRDILFIYGLKMDTAGLL